MNLREVLQTQLNGYSEYHQSKANLILHVLLVPLFLAGNIALVVALLGQAWIIAAAGAFTMLLSLALQGRGHKSEPNPTDPFTGPGNALTRLFFEQWLTFPRFVVTGGWFRALRNAR
ncbi:MAG: terminase [Gammaproteobacteria bacterium]|nr:terminase [Gammaproteobacteria bacterium]